MWVPRAVVIARNDTMSCVHIYTHMYYKYYKVKIGLSGAFVFLV